MKYKSRLNLIHINNKYNINVAIHEVELAP